MNIGKNETEPGQDDEIAVREWSGYWNIGRDKWNIEWNNSRGEWDLEWIGCHEGMKYWMK